MEFRKVDAEEENRCYKILAAAQDLLPKLEGTIRQTADFSSVYSIRSRVKDVERLVDKLNQKRQAGRHDYGLKDVSDIIGIRFISLYRQDMPSAIKPALELITNRDLRTAFTGSRLHEFVSYTSNSIPDQDTVNIELKGLYESWLAEQTGVGLILSPRSRYSSVHVVAKLTVSQGNKHYEVPIELQFRSVFEDAWAEIDHKLLYEIGRFGEKPDEAKREAIAQHMSVLKKMIDTAAEYVDVIRRTIIDPSERPTDIRRNLDAADYIHTLAARAGLGEELTEQLAKVLAEKAAIDVQIETGQADTSKERYLDIARKLGELQPHIESAAVNGEAEAMQAIHFSVRMEIALCNILTERDAELNVAIEAYQQIVGDFPGYPGGWFRAGQAYQRLSALTDATTEEARRLADQAFAHFDMAVQTLEACLRLPKDDQTAIISPDQAGYIGKNARRLQCFARWRLVDRRKRAKHPLEERDLRDVITAFQINQAAMDKENDRALRLILANNGAYYAVDAIEISKEINSFPADLPAAQHIAPLLDIIEQDGEDTSDVLYLNTMVRGYLATGQREKAVAAARKILDLNAEGDNLRRNKPSTAYTQEAIERTIKTAWTVVRDSTLPDDQE